MKGMASNKAHQSGIEGQCKNSPDFYDPLVALVSLP